LQSVLGRYRFWGILLFASVPNPLFDLAGVLCGHMLIPFYQFFLATVIGKAIIKAHLQTFFVIMVFSKEHLEGAIAAIDQLIPPLRGKLHMLLEKERTNLHRIGPAAPIKEPSLFGYLWHLLLVAMLAYFVISFINSSVQSYLHKRTEHELAQINARRTLRKDS